MATFTSNVQRGLKEDVSDIINDISPTDTPLVSAIKTQRSTTALIKTKQMRLLQPVPMRRSKVDPTMATLTPTTMISGTTQILTKLSKSLQHQMQLLTDGSG